MSKPFFYIYLEGKEIIQIFNDHYQPGFDDTFCVKTIEIYFSNKQFKGDLKRIRKNKWIKIEGYEFIVEEAVVTEFKKLDQDLKRHIEPNNNDNEIYCLNLEFKTDFITGSEFFKLKSKMKRKRLIKKILGK